MLKSKFIFFEMKVFLLFSILSAFLLIGCGTPWDKPKPSSAVITTTVKAPTPAPSKPPLPACQWNFNGPKRHPCNGEQYCVGSVNCGPASSFTMTVCHPQHCSSASACLADQSPQTKLCEHQLAPFLSQ